MSDRSYLGQEYVSLRTNSSFGWQDPNASVVNAPPRNLAPITPSDVGPILNILMPCPLGPYAHRVFQQHSDVGLCWQDSMFIMLYNADWFKPMLQEHIEFYMQHFFAAGETDLTYGKNVEYEEKDYYGPRGPNGKIQMVKKQKFNTSAKIKPIAAEFQKRYDFGLPLGFWEFYCLELHRYILLGYVFMKQPDMLPEPISEAKPSNLMRRRGSISARNYSKLHKNLKGVMLGYGEPGICPRSFQDPYKWFSKFVEHASKQSHEVKQFTDKTVPAERIEGYFFGINMRHVISVFKCGGLWILYDIDVGCVAFSPEDGIKIEASRISSIKSAPTKSNTYVHTFTLENGSTVSVSMPYSSARATSYPHKNTAPGPAYNNIIGNVSYSYDPNPMVISFVLAQKAPAAPVATVAPANSAPAAKPNSDGGAASGGRRKTRKHRSSKRKLTRNRKYK
jgi:hypothetical protein